MISQISHFSPRFGFFFLPCSAVVLPRDSVTVLVSRRVRRAITARRYIKLSQSKADAFLSGPTACRERCSDNRCSDNRIPLSIYRLIYKKRYPFASGPTACRERCSDNRHLFLYIRRYIKIGILLQVVR